MVSFKVQAAPSSERRQRARTQVSEGVGRGAMRGLSARLRKEGLASTKDLASEGSFSFKELGRRRRSSTDGSFRQRSAESQLGGTSGRSRRTSVDGSFRSRDDEGSFAPSWQSAQDSGGSFVAGGDSPRRGAQQPEGSGGAARTPMRGLAQRLLIAGVAKAGGVASDGSFAIQDKGK